MADFGVLNINKPSGITSREVVNVVDRLARRTKAGHAGTLDPLASGVCVVCLGAATRLIPFVQQLPKTYVGTFLLGRRSPTEDIESDVVELPDPPVPTLEAIQCAARRLTGRILQRPPAFSALKVAGRRAYDLARKGQQPLLEPRPVEVYRIEVVSYQYPELVLHVECGSGTYIRSLGRDLAESLGTGAVLSALVRTAVGNFRLEDAVPLRHLNYANWKAHVLPALRAVDTLPRIELGPDDLVQLRCGRTIRRPGVPPGPQPYAAVDPTGSLAAILVAAGPDQLRPVRNFSA